MKVNMIKNNLKWKHNSKNKMRREGQLLPQTRLNQFKQRRNL